MWLNPAPSQWVEAGDLVTFTLRFGNQARRGEDWTQANVLVTDTLPAGMTLCDIDYSVGVVARDVPILCQISREISWFLMWVEWVTVGGTKST